jgi:hypothetical protein
MSQDLYKFAIDLRQLAYTMPGGHEDRQRGQYFSGCLALGSQTKRLPGRLDHGLSAGF